MLIPYRVKNPTKRFPIATVGIIALNVLVYILTINDSLDIREDVIRNYAFALGSTPWYTFLSASFLHGDIFHIGGNMLFLWVFGPSVEDRLGIGFYLIVYLLTGFVGNFLQAVVDIPFTGAVRPCIGASACIMGVVGAYWYLFSHSTVCVLYWLGWFWRGIWEVEAKWIIAIYVGLDVFQGFLSGAAGAKGGVANFAHVGGAFAGALLCLAMAIQRDSEWVSEARAIHADTKDLSQVPLYSLETMLTDDPCNVNIIRAMVPSALSQHKESMIETAMVRAGNDLIDKDPAFVAHYLLELSGKATSYKSVQLLRIGSALETAGDSQKAINIYRMIVDNYPMEPETEKALYRMAVLAWGTMQDAKYVQLCLNEMAKRFPNGSMMGFAKTLWQSVQKSQPAAADGVPPGGNAS